MLTGKKAAFESLNCNPYLKKSDLRRDYWAAVRGILQDGDCDKVMSQDLLALPLTSQFSPSCAALFHDR